MIPHQPPSKMSLRPLKAEQASNMAPLISTSSQFLGPKDNHHFSPNFFWTLQPKAQTLAPESRQRWGAFTSPTPPQTKQILDPRPQSPEGLCSLRVVIQSTQVDMRQLCVWNRSRAQGQHRKGIIEGRQYIRPVHTWYTTLCHPQVGLIWEFPKIRSLNLDPR